MTATVALTPCSGVLLIKSVEGNHGKMFGLNLKCIGIIERAVKSRPTDKCVLNLTIVTFDKQRVAASSWDPKIVGEPSDDGGAQASNMQVSI